MKRMVLIALILVLPTVIADEFPVQNQNSGFVGWQMSEDSKIGDYRISYPSISDGEDSYMAQNGPFAVVVFYTDSGEDVDQYIWLQEELSLWGYITLVVSDDTSYESVNFTLHGWNNGTINSIAGSQSMFALNHISLGGHGSGAHFAAEIVKSTDYVIDGLFGLGLDSFSSDYPQSVILSRPSSALFLTGTTDEISPAGENVIPYLESWPGAWQVMYPRGANHIGYQETDSFFERLADGDSTMGRDGQQNHALNHILPYLNLSLRGDDSAYGEAFNREDKTVSSDPDSYIDEDLSRSRLYKMQDIVSSRYSVMLNQSVIISSNVTMRDGSAASGNVSCLLPSDELVIGTLQNGVASCYINGTSLLPGPSLIELRIQDNSFSDWLELTIDRIGMPMDVNDPIPEIQFDQHSSITVQGDYFATDPDGEEIYFQAAEFVEENQSRLSISIIQGQLTISHVTDQEWDGTIELNLTLATSDEFLQLTTNVTVLPVNDPVVQTGTIPQQFSVEDGDSIIVDFADYVSDPEGEGLVISAARDYDGIRISTSLSSVLIDPQTHWNGAELVEFTVSDGSTEPLQIFVPINVEPVDDIIEFSSPILSVEFDEDSSLSLDLENFTVDVDDDNLTFTVLGESEILDYSLLGSELILVGAPNHFGTASLNINVSDGVNFAVAQLDANIKSVPDLPTVGISSTDYSGNTLSILWTISDEDGDAGLIYSVIFANNSIEENTECTGSVLLTCLTTTNTNKEGTFLIEVRVWDGNAQEWSNTVTREFEILTNTEVNNNADSEGNLSEWILPIGLGFVTILLIGYMLQSRKN